MATSTEGNLDVLMNMLKTDCRFSKHVFTDAEFAKEEFAKAGIELDSNIYHQLSIGFKTLRDGIKSVSELNDRSIHVVLPTI
jgi:hypothetical protein